MFPIGARLPAIIIDSLRCITRSPLAGITAVPSARNCSSLPQETKKVSDDEPCSDMENPFAKKPRQCVLCRNKINVDWKNTRLLSQFISPFTGRQYDRHITGLCETQHHLIKKELRKSRAMLMMTYISRDPKFKKDPRLFDPFRPSRPNSY